MLQPSKIAYYITVLKALCNFFANFLSMLLLTGQSERKREGNGSVTRTEKAEKIQHVTKGCTQENAKKQGL